MTQLTPLVLYSIDGLGILADPKESQMDPDWSQTVEIYCTQNTSLNQVDKLVVAKVVAKTVHKVTAQFRDISKEMLRELLSDVCASFYRAGLPQELIPPSRWYCKIPRH
jgi:hypothetical protein